MVQPAAALLQLPFQCEVSFHTPETQVPSSGNTIPLQQGSLAAQRNDSWSENQKSWVQELTLLHDIWLIY